MDNNTYSIRPRDDFDLFADAIRRSFAAALTWGDGAVFATNPQRITDQKLSEVYLNSFGADAEARRVHTCSACLSFLSRFGSLVVINDKHEVRSAMFGFVDEKEVPAHFKPALQALQAANIGRRIKHRFWWTEALWGTSPSSCQHQFLRAEGDTHEWRHFQVELPAKYALKDRTRTPGQARAYSAEQAGMIQRGLGYSAFAYDAAVQALQSGRVPEAAKFTAVMDERFALKKAYDAAPLYEKTAMIWRTLATKSEGFCRLSSGSLSELVKDFNDGLTADAAIGRFNKMTKAGVYQVTTAPVKAGNVAQAENLITKLGLARSLERSQVSRSDPALAAHAFWNAAPGEPRTEAVAYAPPKAGGVFGHLKPSNPTPDKAVIQGTEITMQNLMSRLKSATHLRVFTGGNTELFLGSLTTATHADAPPLLAWDSEEARNPYFWYRWPGVSPAEFGVPTPWVEVSRIMPLPSKWVPGKSHHEGAYMELKTGAPSHLDCVGLALFSEGLAPDLKSIRRTLAAHSATGTMTTVEDPTFGMITRNVGSVYFVVELHTLSSISTFTVTSWGT